MESYELSNTLYDSLIWLIISLEINVDIPKEELVRCKARLLKKGASLKDIMVETDHIEMYKNSDNCRLAHHWFTILNEIKEISEMP